MASRAAGFFLGVDGCRGGWLAVRLAAAGGRGEALLAPRWADLPLARAALIAVDMPIGLSERGPRACDRAARALLPRERKSSVFAPPRRYLLAAPDWASALARGRAREGCGLSRQAWNLMPKIRELDAALDPAAQRRVREVHPELVFLRLNGGRGLARKATAEGRGQRLRLLAAAGLTGLETALAALPRASARPDDLLDAAACALAAREIGAGRATRLPAAPARDRRGLRMEIWY